MDYHNVRKEFEPEPKNVKLVLLGESPPAPDKKGKFRYFYDANGRTSEPLFQAVMSALNTVRQGQGERLARIPAARRPVA